MKLRFMAGPQQGRVVDLQGVFLTLGRGRDNDLVLDGDGISRRHGSIICADGVYFVEDSQSTNGVRLNGQCITRREELRVGDKIGVGTHIIQFTDTDTAVKIPDFPLVFEPVREESPVTTPATPVPWVQIILIIALVSCIGFVGWLTLFPPPPSAPPPSATRTIVTRPAGDLPPIAPLPEVNPDTEAAVEPAVPPAVNPAPATGVQAAVTPPAMVPVTPEATPVAAEPPAAVVVPVPEMAVAPPGEAAPAVAMPVEEIKPPTPAPAPVIPLFEVVRLQAMLKAGTARSLTGQVIRVRGVPVTFGRAGNEVNLLFTGNICCVFSAAQFVAVRPAIRAAQKANQPVTIQGTVTPAVVGDGVVIGEASLPP